MAELPLKTGNTGIVSTQGNLGKVSPAGGLSVRRATRFRRKTLYMFHKITDLFASFRVLIELNLLTNDFGKDILANLKSN